MTSYYYEYKVVGTGNFPVDMLRYDACWPAKTSDAIEIATSFDRHNNMEDRLVTIGSHKEPTPDRWKSFGWIIASDSPREEHTIRKTRIN